MYSKLINVAIFFILIFIFGYWLGRMGKPYSGLILTIHKVIGLAIGVYLASSVYRLYQADQLSLVGVASVVTTVIFFIGLVATGGLLSAGKTVPVIVSKMHRFFPYLAVASTGGMIYLLS
jgi:hypothetical protein